MACARKKSFETSPVLAAALNLRQQDRLPFDKPFHQVRKPVPLSSSYLYCQASGLLYHGALYHGASACAHL
jgi:hypothetical protein